MSDTSGRSPGAASSRRSPDRSPLSPQRATGDEAPVSRFHLMLVRLVFVTGFLSGIDLLVPTGRFQVTHAVLALALLGLIAANRTVSGVFVPLFYGIVGLSAVCIVATAGTFGDVSGRLLDTIFRTLLALLVLAAYHSAYVRLRRDVHALFAEYLRVAALFALAGITQQVIFVATRVDIFGFLVTGAKDYGTFLGIAGLSVEPAYYACALLPAGAYFVSQFVSTLRITWVGVAVVVAIVMSTSVVGYVGMFASAALTLLVGMRARRIWVLVFTLPVVFFAIKWTLQQDFVQLRLNDSLRLFDTGLGVSAGANISSYALAVNADIAFRSLIDNFGFGSGFGLWGRTFEHYSGDYSVPYGRSVLPGSGSATSFFLRIVGELGVFGIAIVGWIVRAFARAARGADQALAIPLAASFGAILLRMGEYYENGVLFVVLVAFLLARSTSGGRELGDLER